MFDKQTADSSGTLTVEAADITLAGGREAVPGFAQCGGSAPSPTGSTYREY